MSGVDFNTKHRIVSPPEVFRQHNIEMRLDFTANYGTSTNSKVIDFLKSNDDDGAFVVYTNTASLAKKLHQGLKDALNASDLPPVDILCVHGSQHALKKFHYTRAFCTNAVSKIHPELNIGGFLSTNTGDTGLDHPHLTFEIMRELPRDMHSLIQRQGRCGRQGEE
jgi:superfamily II DNA/RNA helicase